MSNIIVNNKRVFINGKKTFPVMVCKYCYFKANDPNCTPIPSTHDDVFDVHYKDWLPAYTETAGQLEYLGKMFSGSSMMWTAPVDTAGYEMPKSLRDSPNFFGYTQYDEPDSHGVSVSTMQSTYDKIKKIDPDHPVILSVWSKAWDYQSTCDISADDSYPFRTDVDRETALFYWIANRNTYGRQGHAPTTFKNPLLAWLQANGSQASNILPPTPQEMRAQAFLAICAGYDGIVWWAWKGGSGALYNTTTRDAVVSISREIKSLNDHLVSGTVAFSSYPNYSDIVLISNNPVIQSQRSIDWILKESGILIMVNKSHNSISTTVDGKQMTFSPLEVKIMEDGDVHGDGVEIWSCELPLNGYEKSNLGNRRANSACTKSDDGGTEMTIVKEWNNINGTIKSTDAAIPLSPGFTVCMKTQCNSIQSGVWAQIVDRTYCWDIGIYPGQYKDGETNSGKLFFSYEDIKDMPCVNIDMRQLLGQKVHLAVVIKQTAVDFYLNGIFKGSVAHSGQYKTNATAYPNEPYMGVSEYVRIYDQELTQAQIQTDMTGQPGPEPDPQGEPDFSSDLMKALAMTIGSVVAGYIIQKK